MITDPKTPTSVRTIIIPDFLVEEVRHFMAFHSKVSEKSRIFPVSSATLSSTMKRVSGQQGVKNIRIHDLRHSHAFLLISMGFSAVGIAKRMGHKSINITYRYAHMFPAVQIEMVDKLGGDESVGSSRISGFHITAPAARILEEMPHRDELPGLVWVYFDNAVFFQKILKIGIAKLCFDTFCFDI